jgi:cro/CI family transcriptional regulator
MNNSRISEERKKLGLSQEELANKVGVSQKSISKYECGTRRPSYETLTLMANLFGVTVDYLLGNDTKSIEQSPPIKTASVSDTALKYWVDKTGLDYCEVALQLGISEQQLLSYLNDEKDIPCKQLIALSEICEVSTDCLLGLKNKSRDRDFDNTLPFHYNYNIAERIKKLCQEHNIDIQSSYLENLLSLSDAEVFHLIEYGFVPHVDTITKLATNFNVSTDYLLCQIDEQEEKVLKSFQQLNADNKDIIIGEIKKYLKEQRYEESVAAEEPLRRAVGK